MRTQMDKLLRVLDEEADCYRDMKSVLIDEQASLSFLRKERFEQVQQKKEALVVKLQEHEKTRRQLVDRVAETYPVAPSALTVSNLARLLPGPDGAKLRSRADRLRSCMADVRSLNKKNQQLVCHYRDLTTGALKLLAGLMDDDSVYGKPGWNHAAGGYCSGGGRIFCGTG